MKALKKLSCVLLAVLLLMSLTVTAFAAEGDCTLTIQEETADHQYAAYQIFTGDLATVDGKEVLSNIKWGDGITDAGKDALAAALGLSEDDAKDAAKVAEAVKEGTLQKMAETLAPDGVPAASGEGALVENAATFTRADGKYTATVPVGYYLIVDTANPADVENFSMTDYIVQVVGSVDMKPKSGVPTVEKKVQDDDNEGAPEDPNPWQDYADYDLGDAVPFQLTATLPDNYAAYESYELVFHDTMSKGLSFNSDSVEVSVDGVKLESGFAVRAGTEEENACSFEVVIADLKTAAASATKDSKVVVTYNATLIESAVIGPAGNPNEVVLEYSNNPNGTGTGHTPEDEVTVFTFQLVVNKVAPDPTDESKTVPLAGAEFTIEKLTGTDPAAKESWTALTVVQSDKVLDGKTYAGVTFTSSRLDEGIYRVSETKTPAGYNSIEPFYVKIDAANDGTGSLTATQVEYKESGWVEVTENPIAEFGGTVSTGIVSTDILNQSGLQLPETGGIGTTIFYAVGGVLVAAALVLLITKKRMTKES